MGHLFLKLNKNKSTLPIEKITDDLTHLEIQAQALTSLPKLDLPHLKSFSIHLSSLIELPSWIFQLPKLEVLKIKNSPLKSLPEFGDNLAIRILQLSGLEIDEIPESIGKLKKLDTVDFSANQLSDLPDSMHDLKSVHRINLDKNQFQILPLWLDQLPALNHLSLDGNPLTEQEKNRLFKKFGIWF